MALEEKEEAVQMAALEVVEAVPRAVVRSEVSAVMIRQTCLGSTVCPTYAEWHPSQLEAT